jgi:hypothetical protein
MGFKITIIFSFDYKKIRGTNPTKQNAYKIEGSPAGKTESIAFEIEKNRVDLKFKRELTRLISASQIRKDRKYYSFEISNQDLFPERLYMNSNAITYKMDKDGIYNLVTEISNCIIDKKRKR